MAEPYRDNLKEDCIDYYWDHMSFYFDIDEILAIRLICKELETKNEA